MAVLKSFELNGNKKSFANWISNLSPTSTPFTSMIGKEKIDQTQYSWQTDSLAPASAETFEEGSQATLQPRAASKIFTNFTSLVRRAVRVSDTNECTHAYGRRDEMAYQMGKAGKEILRDIEYMNLSTRTGNIGDDTKASAHSGFKELCAPMFMPDPDTFAMTHRGVAVVDPAKPWFALNDIFKVTTDLFLSGSKADKIMFHPKHMNVFSDKIGFNEEEPMIFRLFDNLDTRFNANVSKIKDPVGRVYTLVPNRYMPEGQIYIFSEDDWTQMVLQQPVRKTLSKTGSAKSVFVETEVGLRHKHPYASGVLDLIVINYKSELFTNKSKLTAFINDEATLGVHATDLSGQSLPNIHVILKESDSNIIELESHEEATDVNGEFFIWAKPKNPGKAVVYGHNDNTSHTLLTNPITIEVVPPTVSFEILGKAEVSKEQRINLTVTDSTGSPVPTGTEIYIHADEDLSLVGPSASHVPVGANGVATFTIFPRRVGKIHLRFAFEPGDNVWKTFPFPVDVVDNSFRVVLSPDTKNVLTKHVDPTQHVAVTLYDGTSVVADEEVVFTSVNPEVVAFLDDTYATNASGVATAQMGIEGIGETQIVASYKNKSTSMTIRVGAGSLALSLDKPKLELGDFDGANLTAQILGADGKPAAKAGLHISWNKHPENAQFELEHDSSVTEADGTASVHILGGTVVEKGSIAAYWREAEEEVDIDFEVIPNQYKLAFNDEQDMYVTGALNDQISLNVKVDIDGKPHLSAAGHELTYTSSNTNIISWVNRTGTTGQDGYVNPANLFHADNFGEAIVTVTGPDSDTDKFTPVTKRIISRKPIVSMTATATELLEGDQGQITVVVQDAEGNVIGYNGDLTVITDKSVLSTNNTLTFSGNRAVLDFTTIKLGTAYVNFALPDGTNLTSKGTNRIDVVQPGLRISTNPEEYISGGSVEVKAILSKPATSSASLAGKEITFTVEPDMIPGIPSGLKVATDATGTATVTSTAISGNSDYDITASFNGVSTTYELMCDS